MMKYIMKKIILPVTGIMMLAGGGPINAQTIIKPGSVSGTWTKKESPYLIKGDVQVPAGKTLTIKAGVVVKFDGPYMMNVQGSLIAEGIETDSIVFTVADTTGIKTKARYGWGGIRFDRRPVKWDTARFRMPEDEELKKLITARIKEGSLDTTTKIRLFLTITDEVNDDQLPDSLFRTRESSQLAYCRFEYATAEGRPRPYVFGGAIYIYRYSNLVIKNCRFENNFAYAGGAIYCKEAAPAIINNTITRCSAQSSGGAMVFIHSGPLLIKNRITDNYSGYNGGGVLFYESSPYAVSNKLLRNKAENSGGGMICEKKMDAYLTALKSTHTATVKYTRDDAFEKANLSDISLRNAGSFNGRFQNNIICNNEAATAGGIALYASAPEITNNTISYNIAEKESGGITCVYAAPQVTNCIIYGNSNNQAYLAGESHAQFKYCNIENGISGIKKDTSCKAWTDYSNIISQNPKFTSPAAGDYSLADGSPCIDAGMPDTATLKLATTDLMGKSRVVNCRIDMGAVEYATKTTLTGTEENLTEEDFIKDGDADAGMFTTVFPNPSSGSFTLVIRNNKYTSVTVKIYASSGRMVYNNDFKTSDWFEHRFDLSSFSSGIYLLMVHSGNIVLYKEELVFE